ncbi:invasion associated locus B family protein [Bradyrhizobium pachyrhizi]|uniref:Invasion associated locus B family protein n=1 Tax=Bradyrhizobium pachyrhizi TaxID=280333 RepID=A0A844SM27_9BRAD|nr:invasion associated locus B family protein [Bradyrhizobium pachyrhizi]MVT66525.1 invasion associated locus B family protein [Bradyrhizobium pachyrhizi]WFU57191.1 invasion associated locus B family protein [Bradyrhizobium pachyrhizi]
MTLTATRRLACLALAIWLGAAANAVAQGAPPAAYAVKPSDVVVPEGETLGEFRRMIQPFKNWTLICDESLKSKRRVCNVTQSIVNTQGAIAFNWSLIATADGKPLMAMRIPAAAGVGAQIELAMGDSPDRIVAQTDRCDASFCFATVAIGNVLRRHIRAATPCRVSYQLPQGPIVLEAPLDGLSGVLAKLK